MTTLVILLTQFVFMAFAASGLAARGDQVVPTTTPTPSPALMQARALVGRVRAEIVPSDGQATNDDVTFSKIGYLTLIKWNDDLKVEEYYADTFEPLGLTLPCCDWSKPSRDEGKSCACRHHQALEGLSKKLLSENWNQEAVQGQATLWSRYLFPVQAVRAELETRAQAELETRAQLDPEVNVALEELPARGEC